MFKNTDVTAFFMRILVFTLVFFSFPILIHFFRSGVIKLMKGRTEDEQDRDYSVRKSMTALVSDRLFTSLTLSIVFVPFAIAVFYP